MLKRTPVLVSLLVLGSLTVAGCTSSADDDAAPAPTDVATESAADEAAADEAADDFDLEGLTAAEREQVEPTGACIDGYAIIRPVDTEFTQPEPCDTVSVLGTGSTITLTDVNHLLLESGPNTITVTGGLDSIMSIASGNEVTYDGTAVEPEDSGSDNTFTNVG